MCIQRQLLCVRSHGASLSGDLGERVDARVGGVSLETVREGESAENCLLSGPVVQLLNFYFYSFRNQGNKLCASRSLPTHHYTHTHTLECSHTPP